MQIIRFEGHFVIAALQDEIIRCLRQVLSDVRFEIGEVLFSAFDGAAGANSELGIVNSEKTSAVQSGMGYVLGFKRWVTLVHNLLSH
jgi:hypothetical protein